MNDFYKNIIKRLIDIILSFFGLVIMFIPILVFIIIIKCEDNGPAFFKQKRVAKSDNIIVGNDGKPVGVEFFNLYKFRSMKMNTPHDTPTHLLKNPEEYLLKIGKWMRKYSVDEIPQLINILLGDMSFVGPRPALWNQDDLIVEREKYKANSVVPGLTGWAQINGRDELEIPIKAKFDGEYAKNISFMFDIKCFVGTFAKVLKHEGVVEGYQQKKT